MIKVNETLNSALSETAEATRKIRSIGERIMNIMYSDEIKVHENKQARTDNLYDALGLKFVTGHMCSTPPVIEVTNNQYHELIDSVDISVHGFTTFTLPSLDVQALIQSAHLTSRAAGTINFQFNVGNDYTVRLTVPLSVLSGEDDEFVEYILSKKQQFTTEVVELVNVIGKANELNMILLKHKR